MRKIPKFITEWVNKHKPSLTCEDIYVIYREMYDLYREKGWNVQVVRKHIQSFIESNYFDNYIERCIKLKRLKSSALTEDRFLLKYGPTIGKEKWNSYRYKQSISNSKEYKGMSEAEFSKYNKSRAVTKKNMIKKYGETLGKEKWESYCKRQSYTNSLEYFIEKYGLKDGKEKWDNINYLKGHSLDSYISKFGDNLGLIKYKKYMEKSVKPFYSNISQELFIEIDKEINDIKSYYAIKNKEFGIFNSELSKYTFFDYVIPYLKLCIEYNGNLFHANPKLFTETDTPNPYNKLITSKEIWEVDKIKNDALIKLGYDIIIIWEDDYLNNKQLVIDNMKDLINEKYRTYNRI